MKHIPNALSVARIVLSPLMFLLFRYPFWFILVYTVAGLTDVADGYLARKYHWESRTGVILEMIADPLFFAVAVFAGILATGFSLTRPIVICMVAVVLLRVVNMLYAKRKFNTWNMMHLYSLKAFGCIFSVTLPILVYLQRVPLPLVFTYLGLLALFFFEETVLIKKLDEYDVNCKGLLFLKKKTDTPEDASA